MSAPPGAVCDADGVCRLPGNGTTAGTEKNDDSSSSADGGLVPLPRTLRPLSVLEDESGKKLTPAKVFKGKVGVDAVGGEIEPRRGMQIASAAALGHT